MTSPSCSRGAPAEVAVLAELVDAGVSRAVHLLPTAGRPEIERALDHWEKAFAELGGRD